MTKAIKNPYLKFIGHNSNDVTGSCILLRFFDKTILIDYGLFQNNDDDLDYKINSTRHKDIKPKQIDAIIITHPSHIDHGGLIPALFKDGANCPVYIPKGIKGIYSLMLQDCVKIFGQDSIKNNRQPIYTQDDVDNMLNHIIECEVHDKTKIDNNISFTYYKAEHIPKARQVVVELFDGVNIKRVGFTGDISHKPQQYYISEFEPINEHLDVLVGECTYGGGKRMNKIKDRSKDIDKLKMAIDFAIEHKSKILIPTFANSRLQEMLTTIYDMYSGNPPIRVLIYTPLGESISHEWENVIDKNKELWYDIKKWDKKLFIHDFKDIEYFGNSSDYPLLILSSGGFLKSGGAMAWLKYIMPDPKSYMVFCGYATPESNAGKMKSGELKEIKIDKKVVKNKCKILILNSFSSHMDKKQLLDYYTKLSYNKICLVHGNQDDKIGFSKELKKRLSKANKTSKVIATNYETKVNI